MKICFHPSNEDRIVRAWVHGFMVFTMLVVSVIYFYHNSYWNGSLNIVWAAWNGIACRENMNAYREWCEEADNGEA